MRSSCPPRRRTAVAASLTLSAAVCLSAGLPTAAGASAPARAARPNSVQITSASTGGGSAPGLAKGAIKHTWLIILENKSYDATFTGLNKNSYLWNTLPKQGALLKEYYGTSHYSQGNYESMVSGQAAQPDLQADCDKAATDFSSNALIDTASGSLAKNPNFGQAVSTGGAYSPDGTNGCVEPSHVPTLFNQLDAAGKTWKGYAQDLGAQPGRDDGPCGYPGTATNTPDAVVDSGVSTATTPGTHADSTPLNKPGNFAGVRSFTGVQAAGNDAAGNPGAKEDGYVAKHFPFPWFHSLVDGNVTTPVGGGSDCDASHIANLDSPTQGLVHDLQSAATTPAFSWITPNNCSDAHDAVCKGNNLSGAFTSNGSPDYTGVTPAYDPQGTTPKNYTGGLYASDLFLRWYVPLIERSAAFRDGGLIDITFDEANPAFANSSFNNASDPAFAPGATNSDPAFAPNGGRVTPGIAKPAKASTFLEASAAGQNIDGQNVSTEPAGPNTPLTYRPDGITPNPGPGNDAFINRKPSSGRTDGASAAVGVSSVSTSTILDNAITVGDVGRAVTNAGTSAGIPTGTPCPCFVGPVSDVGPLFPTQAVDGTGTNVVPAASAVAGSFTLVDANGNPVPTTGPVTSVALSGLTASTDRLYDATDVTPGGGDTGSVLISPFIKPGTTTSTKYNHYSWLRTMEDLYSVAGGTAAAPLTPGAGTISTGLDGLGHLGYAAQDGLAGFGSDVFNNIPPRATAAPTLSGAAKVGKLETCNRGSWTGSGALTYAYAWQRNGAAVPGATRPTYTPTGADYRRSLRCVVTATSSAGRAIAATTSFSPTLGNAVVVTRRPSVAGTTRAGSRVSLTAVASSPRATSTRYQWLRNGVAIKSATRSTYVLTRSDSKTGISCRLVLASSGYRNGTTTTPVRRVS